MGTTPTTSTKKVSVKVPREVTAAVAVGASFAVGAFVLRKVLGKSFV